VSQLNFFMLPGDEREFVAFLCSRADTHILAGRFFATPTPQPVRSLRAASRLRTVTLLNAALQRAPRATVRGEGQYSGKYTFDSLRTPCIELSRSRMKDSVLLPGRIYAKVGWLEPKVDNRVFRSWYAAIERWLKQRFVMHRSWWFGPEARAWSLAGGRVAYGDEPSCALVESLKRPSRC
jgi:hypothetical protein